MIWITFSLLAAMLWAVVNVTDKYTMSKLVQEPLIPIVVLGLVGLAMALVIGYVYHFPLMSPWHLLLAFLAGAFYVLTTYFYYQALKRDEVSKVIPLYYLSPVFILLMALEVLNEVLRWEQYLGMLLLVVGAILISVSVPFQFRLNKAAGYMILAAFCYALNQILTKILVRDENFWVVFAYVRVGIFVSLLPVFVWAFTSARPLFRETGARAYRIMIVNQWLNLSGVLAITVALSYGYVTLVNALASVQPFFVLILATLLSFFFPHIIKEESSRSILVIKAIAITFMMGGTVLVS